MNAAGTPLRRGTFRQLSIGLRWTRPRGILTVPRRLSDEQLADLRDRFEPAQQYGRVEVVREDSPRRLSNVVSILSVRRRRLRRLLRGRMRL